MIMGDITDDSSKTVPESAVFRFTCEKCGESVLYNTMKARNSNYTNVKLVKSLPLEVNMFCKCGAPSVKVLVE